MSYLLFFRDLLDKIFSCIIYLPTSIMLVPIWCYKILLSTSNIPVSIRIMDSLLKLSTILFKIESLCASITLEPIASCKILLSASINSISILSLQLLYILVIITSILYLFTARFRS